jgi:hypothetical protein
VLVLGAELLLDERGAHRVVPRQVRELGLADAAVERDEERAIVVGHRPEPDLRH